MRAYLCVSSSPSTSPLPPKYDQCSTPTPTLQDAVTPVLAQDTVTHTAAPQATVTEAVSADWLLSPSGPRETKLPLDHLHASADFPFSPRVPFQVEQSELSKEQDDVSISNAPVAAAPLTGILSFEGADDQGEEVVSAVVK